MTGFCSALEGDTSGERPIRADRPAATTVAREMRAALTVAAAQPRCIAGDVRENALEHARAIREARARIVVFPELSLTGYELDTDPVPPGSEVLTPIVDACAATGAVVLVGAPVEEGGHTHIAMLRVSATGIGVAYRKTFLGGDEQERFSPGDGAVVFEIDGWRIGVGICKDTGVDRHIADVAALDIDLYAAGLVHLPGELDEQERRAARIAQACNTYVAFASFAGPTGGGYDRTAGVSSIWAADGRTIVRAGDAPGEIARAVLAAP